MKIFCKRANFNPNAIDAARRLSEGCGRPEQAFKSIHVAGTNGKGSVSLKIAESLTGLKVGLFTSPHLFSYCERISINGRLISEERARQGLLRLLKIDPEACFFELTTILAFEYFREECVDIAVIETGVGGLYDPTNIIIPCLSVITSIGKDHVETLGGTLDQIAVQKAGIIKKGVPVVIGAKADLPPIIERAQTMGSPLFRAPPVSGFYDLENQAIAKKALDVLNLPYDISGLKKRPPCRFEQEGNTIFDVAHNLDGIARLVEAMELHFPGKPYNCAVGLSRDKDIPNMLSLLAKKADHIFLMKANSPRAVEPEEMGEILKKMGYTAFTASSPFKLHQEKMLLVCGSFYIMQEARKGKVARDQPLLSIR